MRMRENEMQQLSKPKPRRSVLPIFGANAHSSPSAANRYASMLENSVRSPRSKRKSILTADLGQHEWLTHNAVEESKVFVPSDGLSQARSTQSSYTNTSFTDEDGPWQHRKTSARERLMDCLMRTGTDRVLDWLQAVLSLVAVCLYVYQTYDRTTWLHPGFLVLEIGIGVFFLFDWLLSLYLSKNRFNFLCSLISAVDMLTIVPLFVDLVLFFRGEEGLSYMDVPDVNTSSVNRGSRLGDSAQYNFAVFRVTRVLRALRVLRAWKVVRFGALGLSLNAFKTIFTVVALLFCGTGIFLVLEYQQNLPFHEGLYFMFVTITTVGYGDIKPVTVGGQIFVVLFMSVSLIVVPRQLSKLRFNSRKNYLQVKYDNPWRTNGHLLLCGNLSSRALIDFVHELYDESHGQQDLPLCVLTPKKLDKKIKMLLNSRTLGGHVDTVIGSYHSDFDLERCRAREARACFILADRSKTLASAREDANVILGGLLFRNLNPDADLFLSVFHPESLERAKWVIGANRNGGAISVSLLRQQTLAANIMCPGATTLLANLLRSESLDMEAPTIASSRLSEGNKHSHADNMSNYSESKTGSSVETKHAEEGESSLGSMSEQIDVDVQSNSKESQLHAASLPQITNRMKLERKSNLQGEKLESIPSRKSSYRKPFQESMDNAYNGNQPEDESNVWAIEYQWGMCHETYPLVFNSSFQGHGFKWIATVLYHQFGTILLGLLHEGQVVLNPQNYRIIEGDVGFVISRSAEKVQDVCDMFIQAETFQQSLISADRLKDLEEDSTSEVDTKAVFSNTLQARRPQSILRSSVTPLHTPKKKSDSSVDQPGFVQYESAVKQELKSRQRRYSNKKLVAKSGRILGLKAMSQSHAKRNKHVVSASVVVQRPRLTHGNSIYDIFGAANAGEAGAPSHEASKDKMMASTTSNVTETKSKELESIDEKHNGLSEDSPYPAESSAQPVRNVVRNIGRDLDSPTQDSTPQRSFRSARIMQSMVDDNDVNTLHLARSMGEVVLNSCSGMRGHIIAAGNPKNLMYFLLRLRSKSIVRMRKIVVLWNELSDWELLSILPKVYLVRGSAISFADLERVAVQHAHHLVFFGDDNDHLEATPGETVKEMTTNLETVVSSIQSGRQLTPSKGSDNQALVDFQSIMGLTCLSTNPVSILHTCHLKHTSSVRYLRPRLSMVAQQGILHGDLAAEYRRSYKEEAYFMAPSFASGRVLADAMLDRLVSQAYFNPLIIPLFNALVASNDFSSASSLYHKPSRKTKTKLIGKKPHLMHLSVPVKMIGRTFAELFDYVVSHHGFIPVALYRAPVQITWASDKGDRINGKYGYPQSSPASYKPKVEKSHRSAASRFGTNLIREEAWSMKWKKFTSSEADSYRDVVEHNPLPYVYTCPIPGAIINMSDSVICLTSGQDLFSSHTRRESWS